MLEKHLHHSSGLWLAIVQGVVFHLWSDSVTAVPSTIPPLHALTYSYSTTLRRTHRHNHLNTVLHKHVQISSYTGEMGKTQTQTHSSKKTNKNKKPGYFRKDLICQVAHLHSNPAKLQCEIRSNSGLLDSNEWHPYAPICWIMHFT